MAEKQNQLTDAQLAALMERFHTRIDKEPVDIRNAVLYVMANTYNGSNWAFISDKSEEYRDVLLSFKGSKVVSSFAVKGGAMVMLPLDVLFQVLHRHLPEVFGEPQKQDALSARRTNISNFDKYLSTVKGNSVVVGIYNMNDTPNVTVNGKTLKAFNITLEEAANIASARGFKVRVGGQVYTRDSIIRPEVSKAILKELELSPSLTNLIVEFVK